MYFIVNINNNKKISILSPGSPKNAKLSIFF